MSKATFKVKYIGDALDSHSMDVKDLAPALLAMGRAFEDANRILNHDAAKVNLRIQATNAGSFEIVFELYQGLSSQLNAFVSGMSLDDAVALKDLLLGGDGLLALLLWLQNRKINKIIEEGDTIEIVTQDGAKMSFPSKTLPLLQDEGVRSSLKDMASPLKSKGIDSVEIDDGQSEKIVLQKSDQASFKLPEIEEEVLVDETRSAAYTILAPDFEEGNKWRVHDGQSSIWVKFEDYDFIKDVQDKVKAFAKGDTLICDVHVQQIQGKDGLKTEYSIVNVKEHKTAARQLKLT